MSTGRRHAPKRQVVLLRGVIVHFNHNTLNPPGVALVHAQKNGGGVLKGETSWRTVNGIMIRTRNSQTFLHFRRLPWYMVPKR